MPVWGSTRSGPSWRAAPATWSTWPIGGWHRRCRPPRLLGAFDPLLLGWVSRQPFVGEHTIVTRNGVFRPFALVDGRVVATWGLGDAALTVHLLEPVAGCAIDALRMDAIEVLEYLGRRGGEATKVTFVA
jgi:hypothetical protein